MPDTFTREELYDLVWQEPVSEDARMFRQAADIREFVTQVQLRCDNDVISITNERLAEWVNWALREADRIDPVESLRFVDAITELGRSE